MALTDKQVYDLNNMNVAAQNASLGNILKSADGKIGGYIQEMTISGTASYNNSTGVYSVSEFTSLLFIPKESYTVTLGDKEYTSDYIVEKQNLGFSELWLGVYEFHGDIDSEVQIRLSQFDIGQVTSQDTESLNGKTVSISGKFFMLVPSKDIDFSIIGKRIFDEPTVYMANKVLTVSSMGQAKWEDLPIPTATSSYNGKLLGVKLGRYNFVDNPVPTVTTANADKILRVNTSGKWVADDLIIKSSTAGSTKRFKITVDDTGTVTATEYTGA